MTVMIGMRGRQLSVSAVALELGLSEPTVRRWVRSKKLPAYKPGRAYWVDETDLAEFVQNSRTSTGRASGSDRLAVCEL
jgi:excisionase family DNA binding protein